MRPQHAVRADLPEVTRILTAAFLDDPVQRWVFAPAADFAGGLSELMGIMVDSYFDLGHLYVVHGGGGVAGAALWAPPDRRPLGPPHLDRLLAAMGNHLGQEMPTRLGELARTNDHLPAEPHWYLGILGVDPALQSRGTGAALLAPMLAECDASATLAHLESSNPRNIGFYARHGFATTDEYLCGGDGPSMTIMTRRPRRS